MFMNDEYFDKRVNCYEINGCFNDNKSVMIVVGNEGSGLSNEMRNICDWLVYIEKSFNVVDYIDSINVNNALAIVLYQLRLKLN